MIRVGPTGKIIPMQFCALDESPVSTPATVEAEHGEPVVFSLLLTNTSATASSPDSERGLCHELPTPQRLPSTALGVDAA